MIPGVLLQWGWAVFQCRAAAGAVTVWNAGSRLRLSALQVEEGSLSGTSIVCALADKSNSGNDKLLDT